MVRTATRRFCRFLAAVGLFLFASGLRAADPPAIPRAEHPFPQMERSEWLNLNGIWEFAETDDDGDESFLRSASLPDRIVVPFCRESKLSGLERRGFVRNVWYRRVVALPEGWRSPRTLLRFGASDYRTRVWLNGKLLGVHVGGSTPFSFEITGLLAPGDNVLAVHAFDDARGGLQPGGKQCHDEESGGCFYTRTTGIWQTVWLEGVGSSYIRDLWVIPDPESSRALLRVEVDGPGAGLTIQAKASIGGKPVGEARTPAAWRNGNLVLDLEERRLWSPETPDLYDLELTLLRAGEPVDRARSYFGLRSVTIEGRAILLNGKAVFQRLVLDQGFYPEGIWTAPSDEALRGDIELSKSVGFNGARLHQKVFEPRFLWWADRLGYLVWGEFSSWGIDHDRHQADLPFLSEWTEVVRRDRNHPSIIAWCPSNETPVEAATLQAAVVSVTRAIDPTRPVIESSGGSHTIPDPDVRDVHDYDGDPSSLRERWMRRLATDLALPERYGLPGGEKVPFIDSEYGGLGWYEDGAPAWSYGNAPKTPEEFHSRFAGLANALLDNRCFFGFTYTQLTDIEQERNGIFYDDRRPKFDAARLRATLSRRAAYEADPPLAPRAPRGPWAVLVGAVPDGDLARAWRYTDAPPPAEWTAPDFDARGWKAGRAGFGSPGDGRVRTGWTTADLWLRADFDWDGAPFEIAALVLCAAWAEVFLNGGPVWMGDAWPAAYTGFDITSALRKALRPGRNTLAVHAHDDEGARFLDQALLLGLAPREKANHEPPFETPGRPAFLPLPPGAVEPRGWLRDWCLAARDGYTGHMDEVDEAFRQAWAADYTMRGEALRYWEKGAWPYEGGGYWFEGLVKLAYALHDDALLEQAKARLDVVVDRMNEKSILFVWWLDRTDPAHLSADEAGFFDWYAQWTSGQLGRGMAGYYHASRDPRVLRAMEMAYDGDPAFLRKRYAQTNMLPALETYLWSGNPKVRAALTELFEKRVNKHEPGKPPEIGMPFSIVMPRGDLPWYEQAGRYTCNDGGSFDYIHDVHGVMFHELATPWMLGYLWTGDRESLDAVSAYFDLADRNGMQPYGVMVADEHCGPTGAARGTETCVVSAFLWSQLELLRIGGEGRSGDRAERAFFNAAPAIVSRDFKRHVYTQVANRIRPAGGRRDYETKHWPLCCTASLNRFLPNYVTRMWLATFDDGLAAAQYGPSKVTALVARRVPVTLTARTDYPFDPAIEITVDLAAPTRFPLSLRIPGWCAAPRLSVNGIDLSATPAPDGFARIERSWAPGDRIRLELPMAPRLETGRDANCDAPYATVTYGPLLFALPIPEIDLNTPDPAARWGFALNVPSGPAGGAGDFAVERRAMPERWDWPLDSPLKLLAPAVRCEWTPTDEAPLPPGPISAAGPRERIALVPYGCTRFRVALFPVTLRAQERGVLRPRERGT